VNVCTIDNNGNFGTINGTSSTAAVDFLYQVEVQQNVTPEDMEESIGPKIERAVANTLLPELLSSQCSSSVVIIASRQAGGGNNDDNNSGGANVDSASEQISGISAQPSDLVVDGVPCEGGVEETCFLVDAGMTIYGDDPGSLIDSIKNLISRSMRDGNFDSSVDERIVSVRFVNSSRADGDTDGSQGDGADGTATGGVPAFAWILIAVASAITIASCGICVYCFRRRRNEDGDDDGGQEGYNNNNNDRPPSVSLQSGRGEYSSLTSSPEEQHDLG